MSHPGVTWLPWKTAEIAMLDSIIRVRGLTKADTLLFPHRSADAVYRYASKRRVKLGLPPMPRGRRAEVVAVPTSHVPVDSPDFVAACDALHRATVSMCIRRGITLPGLSPAHTRAIAVNLGIAA